MENNETQSPEQALIVLWVIWAAVLSGLFFIQFSIGGGFKTGEAEGDIPYLFVAIALFTAVLSTLLRWLVLPRVKTMAILLPVMIAGLSLAEGCGLLSIFLIGKSAPTIQLLIFGISVLCMIQYIPVYGKRFLDASEGNPQ